MVGFDRRPESLTALMTAAELGGRLAAELRVIHAIDLTDYPVDPDRGDWEDKGQEVLQREQEIVAHRLADYEYGWSYVAVHGEPVRELSRAADESDALIIVVGSRGEGWHRLYDRIASPSVSHRLIQHCGRPVLVVCRCHHEHSTGLTRILSPHSYPTPPRMPRTFCLVPHPPAEPASAQAPRSPDSCTSASYCWAP